MADEKKDSGFVIKDKRILSEDNEAGGEKPASSPSEEKPEFKKNVKNKPIQDERFDYPPINFSNFVLSLSTSAFFHFGDFPDPVSGKVQKDLQAAKQTIDMLDMISEKTKGNLDDQEKNLIQGVLYELKMRYVKENV